MYLCKLAKYCNKNTSKIYYITFTYTIRLKCNQDFLEKCNIMMEFTKYCTDSCLMSFTTACSSWWCQCALRSRTCILTLSTQKPPRWVDLGVTFRQCFMQDENVACHDLGKVSFERAVGCFGKIQLERATRFPNVPSRARDSLLNVQI